MNLRHPLFLLPLIVALSVSCAGEQAAYDPQSYDDLSGHTVCLLEGSVQADYANRHLLDKDIKFVYFPSVTDCMLAVQMNKADVFFAADVNAYNEAFKDQHLRVSHITEDLKCPIAFGVKKGNTVLKEQCDHLLDSLARTGDLAEIVDRWFDPNNTDYHDAVRIPPIPSIPENTEKVLKLGISGVKQPAEVLIDNKWTGLEIELAQRIAARYGYSIEVKTYDFNNLIPAVQTGKEDLICATMMINEERLEKIDFTYPHALVKGAFFVADKSPDERGSIIDRLARSIEISLIKENRWKLIVDGLLTTLFITILSLLGGAILGGAVCRMRMSGRPLLTKFSKLYLYFMRNTPILVLLMLMFYVVFAKSGLSAVWIAIIAFSMNSSAFFSETFRTGILSVDKGQTEAGRAMGCSAFKTFIYIVAPQAARMSLPVFKNECVTLLKGTSVVGYISIIDITKASDLIRSATFEAFIPLIIITVFYFIIASIITTALDYLMNKL